MTQSTGLRTPLAPSTPKVSSAVRGCMQRGSESGLMGMAPHVAWLGVGVGVGVGLELELGLGLR